MVPKPAREDRSFLNSPLGVLLLGAVITALFGLYFQNKSFMLNELFKARLDRTSRAQDDAAKLRTEIDKARRYIRSAERDARSSLNSMPPERYSAYRQKVCDVDSVEPTLDMLRDSFYECSRLRDYLSPVDEDKAITQSISTLEDKIRALIGCAERSGCPVCDKEGQAAVDAAGEMVRSCSKLSDGLIRRYSRFLWWW